MFAKRSISVFAPSEIQVLRSQRLRSGQCVRCFYASVRARATEDGSNGGNDRGTPYNAPKQGPTRQQRSTVISAEVKMLQRDHPSPSFAEPDPNTLRPAGAGKTVDPEALGHNLPAGRMGERLPASREGPDAQGVGRVISAEDDIMDDTGSRTIRGTRTPHDTVEDPAQGGTSVLEASVVGGSTGHAAEVDESVTGYDLSKSSIQALSASSFEPELASRNELLHGQHNPSTIAAANFAGVLEDRIKTIAESGQSESFRDPTSLARKMMSGQLVRFQSQAEKAAVEEGAKQIAERLATRYARSQKLSPDEVQPSAINYEFAPLPETVRKTMVEKLVAGKYDADGILQGKEKHKRPVLNELARMAMKNGTYLAGDGDRFLRKVQSLLPALQSGQQQRAGQQRAKAK